MKLARANNRGFLTAGVLSLLIGGCHCYPTDYRGAGILTRGGPRTDFTIRLPLIDLAAEGHADSSLDGICTERAAVVLIGPQAVVRALTSDPRISVTVNLVARDGAIVRSAGGLLASAWTSTSVYQRDDLTMLAPGKGLFLDGLQSDGLRLRLEWSPGVDSAPHQYLEPTIIRLAPRGWEL